MKHRQLRRIPYLPQAILAVVLLGLFLGFMALRHPSPLKAPKIVKSSATSNSLFFAQNRVYSVKLGERNTNQPAIEYALPTGNKISFTYADTKGKLAAPITTSDTITFPNVSPDVDLKYTTLPSGLKEEFIFKKQILNPTLKFNLNATNAYPESQTTTLFSGIFRDEKGKYLFHFEKPFAIDAQGNRSDNVTLQIEKDLKTNTYIASLSLDRNWLESPDRVYPITVDPTILHDTTAEFATGEFNRVKDTGSGSAPSLESYYQELPADQYTVGLWHMNEASGNILDSSGNGHTGTVNGTTVTTGILGNGRSFNGTSDYIEIPDSPDLDLTNNFTLEAWVYRSTDTGDWERIISKSATDGYDYWMQIDNTDTISCGVVKTDGNSTVVRGQTKIVTGVWIHLACTYNASNNLTLYLNGKKELFAQTVTGTSAPARTSTRNLQLGRLGSGSIFYYKFIGIIDEVRISNIARSDEQIAKDASVRPYALYESPILDLTYVTSWSPLQWTASGLATGNGETPYSTSGLVAQWNFNETSGTTASVTSGSCGTSCNATLNQFSSTSGQDLAQSTGSGGTVTYFANKTIHTFYSSGTFTPSAAMNANVLVVAGGGEGGDDVGGGGGGGGVIYTSNFLVTSGAKTVTVGNGGSGGSGVGNNGENSVFSTITAIGGGGGGSYDGLSGNAGGSGGGGGGYSGAGGTSTSGQGYWGGDAWGGSYCGGGGGGAGGYGMTGVDEYGASGGNGVTSSITGTSTYYGGGGGAGGSLGEGYGGYGGGGTGSIRGTPGVDGSANTGGGGGGPGGPDGGGAGGSGVVIVSYPNAPSGWTSANRRWGTGALTFDGVDDYAALSSGSYADFTTGDFSLEFWVKSTGPHDTNWPMLISKEGGTTRQGYDFLLNQPSSYAPVPKFDIWSGGVQAQTYASTDIRDGQWHHLVGVKTSSTISIYVDGVLEGQSSHSLGSLSNTSYPLTFGRRSNSDTFYASATLDAVRIYSRALSSAEILANYNSSNVEFQTRVGDTTTPNDGTWEAWRTITGETQIQSFNADAANWAWDNTGTYMPKTKTDDTSIKAEGTGALKLTSGILQTDANTLALWHMDETSGTGAYIHDSSANANHITPTGTTTTAGISNQGRYFNGSSDYLTLPSGFSNFTTGLTIELWAKPTAASNFARFVDLGNTSGTGNYNIIFYRNGTTNTLVLYSGNGTSTSNINVAEGIINNEWHHYAATINSSGVATIYRDGTSLITGSVYVPANTSRAYNYIGKSNWSSDSLYTGYMDEVRISNTARSAEEIAEDYRAGRDHRLNRTITSANLTSVTKLPFYIASDRLGTFSQLTVGESAFANNEPDANTVALWHFDEDKLWDGEKPYNSTGLVAWYHMNESSGNLIDSSGNNNTGTVTGTTVITNGVYNNARSFSSNYVSVADSTSLDFGNNVTVMGWIYANSLSSRMNIYSASNNDTANAFWLEVGPGNGGTNRITASVNGVFVADTVNNVITAGKWYHIAYTRNGTGATHAFYVNGVAVTLNSNGTTAYADNAVGKLIGARTSTTQRFNGRIDELRIYNRALSATEIAADYASPAYLKDSSGNGYHATPVGETAMTQGKFGHGINFDINVPDAVTFPSLNLGTNYTIDAWVKFTTNWTGYRTLFANNGGTYHYAIIQGNTNQLGIYNSTAFYSCGIDVSTLSDTWHHLAIVVSSGNTYTQFYLDGFPACRSYTKIASQNIGAIGNYTGDQGWQGAGAIMDEVRISNIARSADDIRQTFEIGARTHNITIDFKAALDSGSPGGLITGSTDLSFGVNETANGSSTVAGHLFPGEKIIVKENVDGTEYIAQGTVNTINHSTGATLVTAWDSGSTFPSGGFSANATVFKWQREYFDITNPLTAHKDAVTRLTYRITDGSAGNTIWLDDLRSSTGYLEIPSGSTIGSSLNKRYFQYRSILSQNSDPAPSAGLNSVSLTYTENEIPNTPSLDSPTDTATNQSVYPVLKTTATDNDGDFLQYKIELCTDSAMTLNCQTFDQTVSQTGWSGQNTQTNTAYTSGTQATYTVQSNLAVGTTYYWRSYVIDPAGRNVWSATQTTPYSFTTTNTPNTPTSLQTNGFASPTTVNIANPILFTAYHSDPDSDSAQYYQVEVNTNSSFTGTVMWNSGKTAFGSPVANNSRTSNITYAGSTLSTSTTYYWRIMIWDTNNAASSYSTVASFTTNSAPTTPTLDSPTDTATSIPSLVSFKTTATDADSDYLQYKIELCRDAAMTLYCFTFDQTTSQTGWSGQNTQTNTAYTSGTQATYTLSSYLYPNTQYFWRSYAIDPAGLNSWAGPQTPPHSFTTGNSPNIPSLDSPANTSISIPVTAIFKTTTTDTESDYLRYRILLCTDSAMTLNCQTFDQTVSQTGWSGQNTQTGTAYTSGTQATYTAQTPLSANTAYYWKSQAIDPAGSYSWGSLQTTPYSFTTSQVPNTPSLVSPLNGATNQPILLTLTTSATDPDSDNLQYKIELCTDLGMTANCQTFDQTVSQTGWSATSYTSGTNALYTLQSPLSASTTYYWRSYAIDPAGSNTWSGTQGTPNSFSTNNTPNSPTLNSPTNTATEVTLTAVFTLSTTDVESDYLRYRIRLCTNASMTANCQTFDQTVSQTGWSGQNTQTGTAYTSGTQATYTVQSNLAVGTTYYWTAYATDPGGSNSWSTAPTTFSFTTKITSNMPAPCTTVKAANNSNITVNWTDNSSNEDGYQVWKVIDGGLPSQLGSNLAANTVQLVDSAITFNHSYGYLIRSLRVDGTNMIYSDWCYTSTSNIPSSLNSLLIN